MVYLINIANALIILFFALMVRSETIHKDPTLEFRYEIIEKTLSLEKLEEPKKKEAAKNSEEEKVVEPLRVLLTKLLSPGDSEYIGKFEAKSFLTESNCSFIVEDGGKCTRNRFIP